MKKIIIAIIVLCTMMAFTCCGNNPQNSDTDWLDNISEDVISDNKESKENPEDNSAENFVDVESGISSPEVDKVKDTEDGIEYAPNPDSYTESDIRKDQADNTDTEDTAKSNVDKASEQIIDNDSQKDIEQSVEQSTEQKSEQRDEATLDDTPSDEPQLGDTSERIEGYTEPVSVKDAEIQKEAEALKGALAPRHEQLSPSADGILFKSNEYAVIDYSNTCDGYVMVKYAVPCDDRLKVQLKGPQTTYSYNIMPESWEVFPLSQGDGSYTLTVYRNVVDSKYASVLSITFDAELRDEFTAFLYPNQYVDYASAPNTIEKAYELTKYEDDPLMKLSAIYDYVVTTLVYDKERAATVKSGYLPVLDEVIENKKGICFDYASLMTGMLRSIGVPCKLVVGYAGSSYHAWISVWTKESGWIDGAIYFDGISWHRMDPTFASSADRSASIMEYIGDGKNYTEKYLY